MPQRLLNNQYNNFILQELIRPYQGMIGLERRVEHLTYHKKYKSPIIFYYYDLLDLVSNEKWFDVCMTRIAKVYTHIDFSFFRTDTIGDLMKKVLLEKGVISLEIGDY